ncbi:MAG: hypothetical protein P4L80_06475 [Xanthobacteraceae bacterium]|nr:hypothetical protein [Xanthobacteraceae bacterium]
MISNGEMLWGAAKAPAEETLLPAWKRIVWAHGIMGSADWAGTEEKYLAAQLAAQLGKLITLAEAVLLDEPPRAVWSELQEILASVDWSDADEKHFAAELSELIARTKPALLLVKSLRVRDLMGQMLAYLPCWLPLSDEEWQKATTFVEDALDEFPYAVWSELLWCFAISGIRPRARGRKPKWVTSDGWVTSDAIFFADDVELLLKAKGLNRSREKGLRQIINILRERAPRRYGKYSEERLRKAYYEVVRHIPNPPDPPGAQSEKSAR